MTKQKQRHMRHIVESIRRAFSEFLTLPSMVICCFILLAGFTYGLDSIHEVGTHGLANGLLFADQDAVRNFLGVIASSIITLTSITFALLLIAVQQGATALTNQVFDQFLRRRANQLYFGFFIGLALYALIVLATTGPTHDSAYGVVVAFLMTIVALYLLMTLIYTTIDQMRPVMIIKAIREHTLVARECQLPLLRETKRLSRGPAPVSVRVSADSSGFLVRIDAPAIIKAAASSSGEVEVVLLHSIGGYVAYLDSIAEIRTKAGADLSRMIQIIQNSVVLEDQRDLANDPAFGIEQLLTIGWTSMSTAKSNPHPGMLVCLSLHDILARWFNSDDGPRAHNHCEEKSIIVYHDDVPEQLMKAFESLMVVASESMQHQSLSTILQTLAKMYPRLPHPLQSRAEDILLRSLSALGEHVLTKELDDALTDVAAALHRSGQVASTESIQAAQRQLRSSIGRLSSRSTRAEIGSARLNPSGETGGEIKVQADPRTASGVWHSDAIVQRGRRADAAQGHAGNTGDR